MTATIKVDFDRDSWLWVPESWPWQDFTDAKHWATTVAQLFADAYGLEAGVQTWLCDSLLSIEAGCPDGELRLVYLADPNRVFFVSILVNAESAIPLEDLAVVHDTHVTRPPEVAVFSAPALGEGLRCVRYVDTGEPDHDIAGIAHHAWKSGGLDIVVIAASFNLPELDELLPAIDELARSISVVDT